MVITAWQKYSIAQELWSFLFFPHTIMLKQTASALYNLQSFQRLNKWMNVGPVAAALVRCYGHIYVNERSWLTDVELFTFSNSESSSFRLSYSLNVRPVLFKSVQILTADRRLSEEPKLTISKDH